MTFNAAALRLMADKGLSAHDIAEIAAVNEHSGDNAAERRRAWDRERKREQREAERLSGGMSGGNPPDPSPNERDNLTPTRVKTDPKGSSKSLVEIEKIEAIGACLRKAFPEPNGVTAEQWSAFRGQRKKKLNDRSYALLCRKLDKLAEAGWPPGEMIDLAIERGWETVFAPRNFANDRPKQASLSTVVHRILGNGGIDGRASENAGAGCANLDERGTAGNLAARSG